MTAQPDDPETRDDGEARDGRGTDAPGIDDRPAPRNLFTHGRTGDALRRSPVGDRDASDAREAEGPELADTSPGEGGQAEDAPEDTASRGEAG